MAEYQAQLLNLENESATDSDLSVYSTPESNNAELEVDVHGLTALDYARADSLTDPSIFAFVQLGQDLWQRQRAIAESVAANPETAVKACHSSGKTYLAASIALWWLARWRDGIVVTTAPTDLQVRKLLWGEIGATVAQSRYPFPKPNQTELKFNPKRYGIGFSTNVTQQNQGVKFQGFHSGHILIIVDEAPGVHPGIFDAIKGIMAGGKVSVLYLGNPTINSGQFYDLFEKNRATVQTFTISAFDTPNLQGLKMADLIRMERECPAELDNNVRPYLTTRRWVLDRYHEWGEDHPLYQSRVLGQFPAQSAYSLISLTWLEKAKLREAEAKDDEYIYAGLDVAGPGEDETVLTIRKGNKILSLDAWPKEDPRGDILVKLRPYKGKLKTVNIDCIGVGWGIYLSLRDELGSVCVPVNVGKASEKPDEYINLKAELYWDLREKFKADRIWGLNDEKAIGQLAGLRYDTDAKGHICIEKKKDATKRGVKSPDRAESIMLAFAKPMIQGAGLMEWMENVTGLIGVGIDELEENHT